MDRAVPYGAIDGQLDAAPVMSRHKAVRDSYVRIAFNSGPYIGSSSCSVGSTLVPSYTITTDCDLACTGAKLPSKRAKVRRVP